ncbi:MAG TPA: hypothetical protein VMJ65_16330 [Solirubrobacteraceae bacterium]|nr:hypothetical protein [Solirubrobacteraceae bacterium]
MKERDRRQSWRATRRELAKTMSRRGRKWIREVWAASARTAAALERLSPVTTPLGRRLVESYAAREQADSAEMYRALSVALAYGYAVRTVIVEPTDQPRLKPSAFQLSAQTDVDRLANDEAMPKRLLDPVRSIASSDQFDSVMTLPPTVWNGFVATATMRLQRQFTNSNKAKLTWRELSRERIEKMLRYGYALRCLDEAIDAEPELRVPDSDSDTGTDADPVAEGLDTASQPRAARGG